MKKRIFSILLSIGLTLTLLPGTVLATGPDAGPADEITAVSQAPVMIETAEEPLQTPDEAEEAELLQVPEETPGEVTPEEETPGEEIMTLQAAAQGDTVSQAIQTDALGADAPATVEMHVATYGHGKVRVDGTDYDTEFKGEREDGTNVQVEAVPDAGYKLGRWLIRKNSGNPVLVYDAATTLVAGTDLEAIAYFGLEKAYVTITPPAAGTTAATAPQITFPDGAGYSLDTLPWEGPATYWTTAESLSTQYPDILDESTVFEAGQTYYAYVRLADSADSFAAVAGGASFNTDLEVSGGKKMDQGNFAAWREEHGNYTGIMAIIAVTIPEANTHTVTFDTQGNYTPVPAPQMVADGEKATRPAHPQYNEKAADYDMTGLYFRGWYTKPANEISSYYEFCYSKSGHPDGCIFDFNAPITKNMTAYAVYEGTLTIQAYDVTKSKKQAGGTFDYKNYSSLNYSNASLLWTTAFYNIPEFLMAKPANGYKFAGWSTSTSKDDIISTEAEYQYIFKKNTTLYALFEEEAPSYELSFTFANAFPGAAAQTLLESLTVNGEDWTPTSSIAAKDIPAGSSVTATVKVVDDASFAAHGNPGKTIADLVADYSDDGSEIAFAFTMPETDARVEVYLFETVTVSYDANDGVKDVGWVDSEKYSKYTASLQPATINVSQELYNPTSSFAPRVQPPTGGTFAGIEVTQNKTGTTITGAPGQTITVDFSEGGTIKFLWTRDIDKVEVTLNAPVCGTETATPDKDHSWGSQTNPPSVSVPDGAGYKPLIMYEGASPAIWVDPDQEYKPFEGTIEGEKSYTAQIMLEPDSGAVFSEDVEIVVNGGTLVDKDLNGSVLAVFASVTAVHIPADPVEENRVEPTCVAAGSYDEVVYCAGCRKELSREKKEIPATGEHTWNEGVVTTEPTCTTAGVKTFTCTVCGENKTEEIPAPGHTPGSPVKENEVTPTCTEAGSYDVVVYCTVCGEEISRNAVDIPALGHNWGEWTQTTETTCTEPGVETRTCTRCGEAETREVAALGHDWGEWTIDKEATEEADGLRHRECSRCGEKEEEVIPKIEVSYDIVEGDGATWYTGSNDSLTFTFKRSVNDEKTFELFQRIEIDGKEVAPANYEAKAGSVIITLKPEYIKTLAVGKHTLTAVFENGKTADATFTIAEKKADVVPGGDTAKKGTGVKTGDNANAVLYMGLGIAALLIIAVTLILLKRRSRNEQ